MGTTGTFSANVLVNTRHRRDVLDEHFDEHSDFRHHRDVLGERLDSTGHHRDVLDERSDFGHHRDVLDERFDIQRAPQERSRRTQRLWVPYGSVLDEHSDLGHHRNDRNVIDGHSDACSCWTRLR